MARRTLSLVPPPRFRAVHLDDVEPVPALDGQLLWRPLRATLGVHAFGVNAYTARAAGDLVVEEHDETGSGAGGHEELYVVVSGHARFTIAGEDVDAPAGTCVFLPDPAVVRTAVGLRPGTTVLAVGAPAGEPYRVSPWEYFFRAGPYAEAGDWGRAARVAAEGLEEHPDNAALLYNLACFEVRAGRLDDAMGHLRDAAAADPEQVRQWAAEDADLDALRGREGFPA
jgi:tetratricopeptide (TPR) repeat protein